MIRWEGGGLCGVPLLRSAWVVPPQGWRSPSKVPRHTSHGLEPGPPGLTGPAAADLGPRGPLSLLPEPSRPHPLLLAPSPLGSK